ncbi:MAG: hypothetical protein ACI9W6_002558 [Motiliproteus sp.]|jgi:uncharacterized protein YccT (UPF0319 family)
MKSLGCFILSTSFLISSMSFAAVSVEVAEGVALLALNGEETASYSKKIFQTVDGVNQMLVEFSAEIKEYNNDSYIERTPAYVILFESTDERLRLNAPNINNSHDLSAFKTDPRWVMTTENGKTKEITVTELVKEGFQLSRDYETELAIFNRTDSPAVMIPDERSSVVEGNIEAGEMLKYWYTKSSPEARTAFIRWLDE